MESTKYELVCFKRTITLVQKPRDITEGKKAEPLQRKKKTTKNNQQLSRAQAN